MDSKKKICKVASILPHFGEEPFISGTKGSGTIFFSHCTMHCIYCQNWQISAEGMGKAISEEELADEMLNLQNQGCHNINLVSPTQYVSQIINALKIAKQKALLIPIVYNTNGYDSLETLRKLEGLIDIYLPDIKYSNNKTAYELSAVKNYV